MVVVLAISMSACGSSDSTASARARRESSEATTSHGASSSVAVPGVEITRAVTTVTETFVDPTRATRGVAGRTLVTDIYIPDGEGPFPLIVHAHGFRGDRTKFTQLLGAWAARGFVVAAPSFPLTNGALAPADNDIGDLVHQPGDMTFLIDQLLAASAGSDGPLVGRIDPAHIGVSGLSLGGGSVYPLVFNPAVRDDRVTAMIAMSAVGLVSFGGEVSDLSRPFPTLVFAGDADRTVPYQVQRDTWSQLAGPTWLVTLHDGAHSPPYEDSVDAHDQLVIDTSIDFWGAFLRDDATARSRITTDGNVDGLASVESRTA